MANQEAFAQDAMPALPNVRTITPAQLREVLEKGLDDFRAMPTHAAFLSLIYPIVGLLVARAALGYDMVPLLYPMAAGFALLGPIAAIGLYELSRRREMGLTTTWEDAFGVFRSPSILSIAILGVLLLGIFGVWIALAQSIYVAHFGYASPSSLSGFVRDVLTTPTGRSMILIGNVVGFLFAVLVLAISAVSFPLLIDRNASAMAAIATSVKVVLHNPGTMALWGLIIAAGLFIGSLPLFFGLAVVMPILGHASWHLYRMAVEPAADPRPEERLPPRGGRYAADFPASLIPWARENER